MTDQKPKQKALTCDAIDQANEVIDIQHPVVASDAGFTEALEINNEQANRVETSLEAQSHKIVTSDSDTKLCGKTLEQHFEAVEKYDQLVGRPIVRTLADYKAWKKEFTTNTFHIPRMAVHAYVRAENVIPHDLKLRIEAMRSAVIVFSRDLRFLHSYDLATERFRRAYGRLLDNNYSDLKLITTNTPETTLGFRARQLLFHRKVWRMNRKICKVAMNMLERSTVEEAGLFVQQEWKTNFGEKGIESLKVPCLFPHAQTKSEKKRRKTAHAAETEKDKVEKSDQILSIENQGFST